MSETETVETEPESQDSASETEVIESETLDRMTAQLGDAIVGTHARGDDLWVRVTNEAWADTAATLRHTLGMRFFAFLSVIDWLPSPFGRYLETEGDTLAKFAEAAKADAVSEFETGYAGGERRFQVFARVTSLATGQSVTVKADTTSDTDPQIASWTSIYAGADWHEREAWEMYGVTFTGHPGLRHMYLPGGFEGNPMRKDFPLLARLVKPWPGIVDVEPMPASEPDESSADADGGAAEGEGEA